MKKLTKLSLVAAAAAAAVQIGDIGGCNSPRFSPYMNDVQVAKERRKNKFNSKCKLLKPNKIKKKR